MDTTIPPEITAAILPHLTHRFAPCSAYAFGFRQQAGGISHIYILVITGRPAYNDPVSVADEMLRATGIRPTLLVHRPRHLHVKPPCQKAFFHNILRNGQRLCLDTARVPYMLDNAAPVRDAVLVRQHWLKCEAVASQYMEAADSARLDVELVKIAMLHTAAAFAALGLVRVFLGYMPPDVRLRQLLDLCTLFTALPDEVFAPATPAGSRRLKMLCAPPSMLRHWQRLEAPGEDFAELYRACGMFIEKAGALADAHLENNLIYG